MQCRFFCYDRWPGPYEHEVILRAGTALVMNRHGQVEPFSLGMDSSKIIGHAMYDVTLDNPLTVDILASSGMTVRLSTPLSPSRANSFGWDNRRPASE